jgi:cytochrome c nitrite reductase small subunit
VRASSVSVVVLAALLGAAGGLGAYTFAYARGWSYVTDDARACANCHVMNEVFDGWIKGSHRSVAVCNDCHVPHALVPKYFTKARNGFWHSFYFTTDGFHEPIRATARSRAIAEANCRRCHGDVSDAIGASAHSGPAGVSCVRCHGSVGHLELSATNVSDPGGRP